MDIKRKVEVWVCRRLMEALPGQRFLPSKGDLPLTIEGAADLSDAQDTPDPPFTVIEAQEATRMLQDEPTWSVELTATYVTHIDDTKMSAHSAAVSALHDALQGLPRGYDSDVVLAVHGSDITGTDSISDAARRSHGDVISLVVACTG